MKVAGMQCGAGRMGKAEETGNLGESDLGQDGQGELGKTENGR